MAPQGVKNLHQNFSFYLRSTSSCTSSYFPPPADVSSCKWPKSCGRLTKPPRIAVEFPELQHNHVTQVGEKPAGITCFLCLYSQYLTWRRISDKPGNLKWSYLKKNPNQNPTTNHNFLFKFTPSFCYSVIRGLHKKHKNILIFQPFCCLELTQKKPQDGFPCHFNSFFLLPDPQSVINVSRLWFYSKLPQKT